MKSMYMMTMMMIIVMIIDSDGDVSGDDCDGYI